MPRRIMLNFVRAFGRTVGLIDPNTAGHLAATGRFAATLARRLRFGPAAARVVHLGAVLHDIGKVGVPPTLLLRQGQLSALEFALVQEHPRIGWEIAREAGLDRPIATVIKQHHERLDGSGYPEALSDGGIMREAMAVAVADEVHALVARRGYRAGLDETAAIKILQADAASKLPRAYVDAAIDLMREGKVH